MTDAAATLIWCGIILLAFCACGALAELALRRRDHRRAVRRQMRRARSYTALETTRQTNVVEMPGYSVKVPVDERWAWRVDGAAS
jgi:hypothetical protein